MQKMTPDDFLEFVFAVTFSEYIISQVCFKSQFLNDLYLFVLVAESQVFNFNKCYVILCKTVFTICSLILMIAQFSTDFLKIINNCLDN